MKLKIPQTPDEHVPPVNFGDHALACTRTYDWDEDENHVMGATCSVWLFNSHRTDPEVVSFEVEIGQTEFDIPDETLAALMRVKFVRFAVEDMRMSPGSEAVIEALRAIERAIKQ
jgi:hypothetical protein